MTKPDLHRRFNFGIADWQPNKEIVKHNFSRCMELIVRTNEQFDDVKHKINDLPITIFTAKQLLSEITLLKR